MDYRIILIGDTHYDTVTEVYHSDYNEPDERLNRIQRAEFARNAKLWSGTSPLMMAAAGRRQTDDTAFVIQVGDLIQGDCGNPQVHSRMMLDALALFKKNFGSTPFLTVTGNHDIRGTGAAEAYRQTAPAYHARELDMEIKSTTYYFRYGEDLFLFIDFNDPAEDVIREAFAVHGDARHKFVITHGPAIPSDCGAIAWMLFGWEDQKEKRAEFRSLFARNNVIVLTGHTHTVEYTVYKEDGGTITQCIVNSVWERQEQKDMKIIADDPASYGTRQVLFDRDTHPLIGEYRPGIQQYHRFDGAGYATLDVTGDSVTIRYYGGDSDQPAATFII